MEITCEICLGRDLYRPPVPRPGPPGPPAHSAPVRLVLMGVPLLLVAAVDPARPSHSNVARNSPVSSSILESASLELQRFRVVSKNDRGKLRAKFVWAGTWQC